MQEEFLYVSLGKENYFKFNSWDHCKYFLWFSYFFSSNYQIKLEILFMVTKWKIENVNLFSW